MKYLLLLLVASCASHQFKPVILPPGQTYQEISTGKVHKNCLEKFGTTLVPLIESAASEGQSCLKKLDGKGSTKLAQDLKKLYASKKITYSCIERSSFWATKKYAAHASINSNHNVKEFDLVHPYVSINPNSVLQFSDTKGEATTPEFMKQIFFHETIHLLGYRHGYEVEYAYACEICCRQSKYSDLELNHVGYKFH